MWAGNQAAVEIHAPMALADDLDAPRMVVFDLDPGPPAAIARVLPGGARPSATSSHAVDLEAWPKTSGSKGLQLYVPVNGAAHPRARRRASPWPSARCSSGSCPNEVLTVDDEGRSAPARCSSTGARTRSTRRRSRVYSLRARPHPTVSTPVTWDEVEPTPPRATPSCASRRPTCWRGSRRSATCSPPTLTLAPGAASAGGPGARRCPGPPTRACRTVSSIQSSPCPPRCGGRRCAGRPGYSTVPAAGAGSGSTAR